MKRKQTVFWRNHENLEDIIDYWNHLPKTTKHQVDYSFKQTRTMDQRLNQLFLGNYIVTNDNGNPYSNLTKFFKSYNIPEYLRTKKWTADEIKDVLKYIQNTSYATKGSNLNDTLWNSYNCVSSFYTHAHDALSLSTKRTRKPKVSHEMVKIVEKDGKRYVDARELWNFLGSKRDFSNWIKRRIDKYNLCEGQDFVLNKLVEAKTVGLQPKIDYNLTVDTAKSLSMVENNEKGVQARQHFIDCEEKFFADNDQEALEQTQKMLKMNDQIKELQNNPCNPNNDLINDALKKIQNQVETNTALILDLQAPQVTLQPVIAIQEIKSIESKVCTRCGIDKPLSDYHKKITGRFGVDSLCKHCKNKANKKHRLKVKTTKKVEPKKNIFNKVIDYLNG